MQHPHHDEDRLINHLRCKHNVPARGGHDTCNKYIMKKILGLKVVLNLSLAVMLIGGLVYSLGFGICLYMARQEVVRETDKKVETSLSYLQCYVDGQLQRVEDVAYTLLSSKFGGTARHVDGGGYVTIDPSHFTLPSEEEVFLLLEQFLNANPFVCGAAVGFEPFVFPDTKGQYGFAAYVTNVSGTNERLRLGEMHDFRSKEWYREAARQNKPYWSLPFRETSRQNIVTCFSLPLHGFDNRLVGVLALDINTEEFRRKCEDSAPLPHAEVALVDRVFRFISHPDSSYILREIDDVAQYVDYKADDSMRIKMEAHEAGHYIVNEGTESEAIFYFAPIERTGWIVSIECPKNDIFGSVERMKRNTTFIAIVSILAMIVCFVYLFRRLQAATMSKVSIENELRIASAIQMGMLPKLYPAFPDRNDIDVYGFLKPAKSVGGDLYDYFIRENKLFFCIGDVSGKGIPASLFMAVLRSLFRNVSLHEDNPAEILSSLNTALSEGNDMSMFCTMFLGVLDLETGHLDYCNAGHNAPVIRRLKDDGTVDVHFMHPKANLAVGVFPDYPYVLEKDELKPGEAIFLYTDGVTEAENVDKNLFGDDATLAALADARSHSATSAKDFVEHVYNTIRLYAVGTEQSDDITMAVVEYKGTQDK